MTTRCPVLFFPGQGRPGARGTRRSSPRGSKANIDQSAWRDGLPPLGIPCGGGASDGGFQRGKPRRGRWRLHPFPLSMPESRNVRNKYRTSFPWIFGLIPDTRKPHAKHGLNRGNLGAVRPILRPVFRGSGGLEDSNTRTTMATGMPILRRAPWCCEASMGRAPVAGGEGVTSRTVSCPRDRSSGGSPLGGRMAGG